MTHAQIAAVVEQIVSAVVHDHGLDVVITRLTPFGARIMRESSFGDDLGMDGEDIHAVFIRCEETFKVSIPDDAITNKSCVGKLIDLVSDLLLEKEARETYKEAVRKAWLGPEDAK